MWLLRWFQFRPRVAAGGALPLLWFLHWNRLPKAGWLCGLFLLAGQVTHPGAPNGDSVAILQGRWVQLLWLFTILLRLFQQNPSFYQLLSWLSHRNLSF